MRVGRAGCGVGNEIVAYKEWRRRRWDLREWATLNASVSYRKWR